MQDEEEELQKQKKILGIFPRKNKGSRNNSGRSTPARKSGDTATGPTTPSRDDDDDDLPPREDHLPPREEEADIGEIPRASHDPRRSGDSPKTSSDEPKTSSPDPVDEEAAVRHIPKTAGFDFEAIGKVLGKDLDVSKIDHHPAPAPAARPTAPRKAPDRTESAPPPAASPAPSDRPGPLRSQTANSFHGLPVEDDGDIAITAQKHAAEQEAASSLEMPSWDRPAWPVEDRKKAPSIFGFNAWASPASASTQSGSFNQTGMRAAPPARPHPPELMANPFANPFASASNGERELGAGSGLGTSRSGPPKRLEDMALENPW